MTLFRFYFFLAVIFGLSAQAVPSCAETLYEASQLVLKKHPSVESAQATLEAAEETRAEQFSSYFPQLSVSGSGGRIFGDNSTSRGLSTTRGTGYSYLWEGSVTARQMIFDGFETQNRVGSAQARLASADLTLADVQEQLALRIVQVYIETMQAYEGLGMLKEHEKKVLDYLERIRVSVEEGTADDTQYQQARDIKVILDGFIDDYEARVENAQALYLELTGKQPEGNMFVPAPDLTFLPDDVESAIRYAGENHPSLNAAAYTVKSAAYDVSTEKAQIYPDVTGELSYLKSDKDDIIGGELEDARALVRMNWNLETGGAQKARIRKKKYEYQATKSQVEDLKRQIATRIRSAYTELETAKSQLENKKKRRDLNTKLFETYGVQFEGARINLVQLMQADNQLFNTKLEKMLGEYRVLAAQYGVLASMGRLQEGLSVQAMQTAQAEDSLESDEQE